MALLVLLATAAMARIIGPGHVDEPEGGANEPAECRLKHCEYPLSGDQAFGFKEKYR